MPLRLLASTLAAAALFAFPAFGEPPAPLPSSAQHVTLTIHHGELPDPEALVQTLVTPGGRHEVRVRAHKTDDSRELTIDLWGSTIDDDQVRSALEKAFPQLTSATVEVSRIDAAPPKAEDGEGAQPGERVIIKKQIIREKIDAK